jgi:hypothetical protein
MIALLLATCRLFLQPSHNKHDCECRNRSDRDPGNATGTQSGAAAIALATLGWDIQDTRGLPGQVDSTVKGKVTHVDNLDRVRWEIRHRCIVQSSTFVGTVGTAKAALRRVAVRLALKHRSGSFNESRLFRSFSDNIIEVEADDTRLAGIIVIIGTGSAIGSAGAHAVEKVVFVLAVTTGVKVGVRLVDNVCLLLNRDLLEGSSRSGIEADSVFDIFRSVLKKGKWY